MKRYYKWTGCEQFSEDLWLYTTMKYLNTVRGMDVAMMFGHDLNEVKYHSRKIANWVERTHPEVRREQLRRCFLTDIFRMSI